jgi:imidazolonepropionase
MGWGCVSTPINCPFQAAPNSRRSSYHHGDHLESAEGIVAAASGVAAGISVCVGLSNYPAARKMIDAGLAIVLATDFNPGSSPTPSMAMVLSLASTHMKMLPAESLTAATINAAYSLGRGELLGSVEPGKIADFVIHDADDYRELAYFFGVEHAWQVYAGGELVYEK